MCNLKENLPHRVVRGLQGYPSKEKSVDTSEVTYLRVMDQNADNPETILETLSWLHQEFDVGKSVDNLIVAGDGKTYLHMKTLKKQCGEALQWPYTFPGDPTNLPRSADVCILGRRTETNSLCQWLQRGNLDKCSNFSNTTTFFFEVWETLYQHILNSYNDHRRTQNTEHVQHSSDGFRVLKDKCIQRR